jgi:GT2 family glycosyltransferase
MLSVISATYKQLPKLKLLAKALESFRDFEWILAIDGCQETKEWAKDIKHVYHEDKGRRYNEIVNMAVKEAKGDTLLLISGDSVPDKNYQNDIMEGYKPDRIVCGLRVNVDDGLKVVSSDHRLIWYPDLNTDKPFKIQGDEPWVAQTSNGMIVDKKVWDKLGGFDEVYKDYGVVDQDFCMRAHYMGIENWWAPKALLNHIHLEKIKDNPNNFEIYEQRKAEYSS